MSRLREGRANTARGAAHFLRETVGRVRYAGASGQITLFYTHAVVAVCRHAIRQHKSLQSHRHTRSCLDADSLLDGRRRRCGRELIPPSRVSRRLIVRRVQPSSQLALFATQLSRPSPRDGETLELEADHRRHAEY